MSFNGRNWLVSSSTEQWRWVHPQCMIDIHVKIIYLITNRCMLLQGRKWPRDSNKLWRGCSGLVMVYRPTWYLACLPDTWPTWYPAYLIPGRPDTWPTWYLADLIPGRPDTWMTWYLAYLIPGRPDTWPTWYLADLIRKGFLDPFFLWS